MLLPDKCEPSKWRRALYRCGTKDPKSSHVLAYTCILPFLMLISKSIYDFLLSFLEQIDNRNFQPGCLENKNDNEHSLPSCQKLHFRDPFSITMAAIDMPLFHLTTPLKRKPQPLFFLSQLDISMRFFHRHSNNGGFFSTPPPLSTPLCVCMAGCVHNCMDSVKTAAVLPQA